MIMHTNEPPFKDTSGGNTEVPLYLRPDFLFESLINGQKTKSFYFIDLMSCIHNSDIASVLRFLPVNLFDEFTEMLKNLAQIEKDEYFGIPGSIPLEWDLRDVRHVLRWLDANPNPELAAPVENVE